MKNYPSLAVSDNQFFGRKNNFDFLRCLFAFIVLFAHAYALSGNQQLSVLGTFFSSEVAVKSFFIVSGFLIFSSYENSSSTKNYFIKRLKRIYPAYFVVIILCTLFGAIFSDLSWNTAFLTAILKYLFFNVIFLNFIAPSIPGIFETHIYQALNGALWTLKVEVMFYLLVPFIVMMSRKFGRLPIMGLIYLSSVFYSMLMLKLANQTGHAWYLELQRQLPGQLTYFICGALAYYYFPLFLKYRNWLLVMAIIILIPQLALPSFIAQPIILAIVIVYIACFVPYLSNFGKYGDFSYGIYILHFPVLQILISYHLFDQSAWGALIFSMILITGLSVIFWHFIEKPFLKKSSHYVGFVGAKNLSPSEVARPAVLG